MLVYNTTYHVEDGQEKYFLIWMREFYLPEVEKEGTLRSPRILRRCVHRVSCVSLVIVRKEVLAILFNSRWRARPYFIAGIANRE